MTAPRLGRLITLEGGEGAGKSTLSKALAAALEERGLTVVQTREPGGSPGADAVRALLVRGEAERWGVLAETLLLYAARSDHLDRVIRPALASGAWVICDRFTDSTRAYQVAGRGLDPGLLDQVHAVVGPERPDLTIVLDIDPAAGVARSRGVESGEDRFEGMTADFHARVRQAFLEIAASEPDRCVVIDTSAPREDVTRQALAAVTARLSPP